VYTGSAVGALVPVASDDSSGPSNTSKLTFNAVAGTTYQIAVDGSGGATGSITLNLGYAYYFFTFAGTAGSSGSADGTGSSARLFGPNSLAVEADGEWVTRPRNLHLRSVGEAGVRRQRPPRYVRSSSTGGDLPMKALVCSALIATTFVLLEAPARADDSAEATVEAPPPEQRGFRVAAAADLSLGRSWVYGVDVDTADLHAALGFTRKRRGPVSVDWLFGVSWTRGQTHAGRTVQGFGLLTFTPVVHVSALRLGVNAELGVLSADRSASRGSQTEVVAGLDGIVGIEPFSVGDSPLYVDARFRLRSWGGAGLNGVSLAMGIRY
jgi:hypothetical protein